MGEAHHRIHHPVDQDNHPDRAVPEEVDHTRPEVAVRIRHLAVDHNPLVPEVDPRNRPVLEVDPHNRLGLEEERRSHRLVDRRDRRNRLVGEVVSRLSRLWCRSLNRYYRGEA